MPSFSGKFRYPNRDGSGVQAGPCQVTFDADTFTLTPSSNAPLAFDLGDIDLLVPAEHELTLTLYTGKKLVLHQFGKAFQNLAHDLLEAYRQRLVQCLLLEDLEEIARFDGFVELRSAVAPQRSFSSSAELRLYKSNLAVLPTQATAFQWRWAEVDAVAFDEATYTVTLPSGTDSLVVTKLAKRTHEFRERVEAGITEIAEKAAQALRQLFPFLTPEQFQQAATLMKEGQAAPLARLQAVHPKLEMALFQNVVDATLRPYFDALLAHTTAGGVYTGFKFIREEEEENGEATVEQSSEAAEAGEQGPQEPQEQAASEVTARIVREGRESILHWFFFPLATRAGASRPGNLVAWEATSRGGRATYFFRLVPPEQAKLLEDVPRADAVRDAAIRQLNRALTLLNFRREPIYLSDDELEMQPRYRRYAIACRKIPELRRLRASFLGRAIHTSPPSWRTQLESFLARG